MSSISLFEPKNNTKDKDSLNITFVLFAQDLVGYVITCCNPSFVMSPIIDNLPQRNNNPFNENVKNAIHCILLYVHRKTLYTFKHLTEAGEAIDVKYIKCAQKLDDNYFCKGFCMTNFLYFCVDISVMSAAYHKSGMQEAPNVAVMCILNKMESHDRRKFFALLNSVIGWFPCISDISLKKTLDKLRQEFDFSLSPLKEIWDIQQSDESSGATSEK